MQSIEAYITYYIQNKLWNSLIIACNDELRKGLDPCFVLWKSFGYFKQGGYAEAIRELQNVQNRQDFQYPATVGLLHYHKACKIPDNEAIMMLGDVVSEAKTLANDRALLYTAQFYLYIQDVDQSMSHVNIILGNNKSYLSALILKGDIYLNYMHLLPEYQQHDSLIQQGLDILEEVIKQSPSPSSYSLQSFITQSKYFLSIKENQKALDLLSQICVVHKKFLPGLLIKAKAHINNGDWELCTEFNSKVLQIDGSNPQAIFIAIFHMLVRESNVEAVVSRQKELEEAMLSREPKNYYLYYFYSKIIARICGRRSMVVQRSLRLLERADKLTNNGNCQVNCEIGYQLSLLGDFVGSFKAYQAAAGLDNSGKNSVDPLYGMILANIRQDQLEQASAQLQFVTQLQSDSIKNSNHLYLQALIQWKKNRNKDKSISLLNKCLSVHVQQTKIVKPGFEFYMQLNPDFLLQIAKEYVQHIGSRQYGPGQRIPPYLGKAIKLLENITKQNCGFTQAQLLLAKARWAQGDNQGALKQLQTCMEIDPNLTQANILSAMINLKSNNFKAAEISLSEAFSQDFKIRSNPLFMLIKSEVEIKNQDFKGALATLQAAFLLPGVQEVQEATDETQDRNARALKARAVLPFGDEQRAKIFLNLATVHTEQGNHEAAKKLIQKAIGQFKGTDQEVRIIVAQSKLFLKQNDVKKALNMLKKIQPESENFVMAREKMAQIYLNQMKDRRSYAKCYQDILDAFPTAENLKLSGDALMKIQEPEQAIKFYEKAYDMNRDSELTRLIGNSLVMTHDYNKAIAFYEHQLQENPNQMDLRIDLAQLYVKRREFDLAKSCIIAGLRNLKQRDPSLIQTQKHNVEFLILMSDVILKETRIIEQNKHLGNMGSNPSGGFQITRKDAVQALKDAKQQQSAIVSMAREQNLDTIEEEREISAKISHKIGQYYMEFDKVYDEAQRSFNDSINRKPDYTPALMSLAQLGAKKGDYNMAQNYAQKLLNIQPANHQATFMLSNLMLLKNDAVSALQCLQKLLKEKPDDFQALAQMIILMRRAGRLQQIGSFIEISKESTSHKSQAGLNYAQGLHYFYTGQTNQALKFFNLSRHDGIFGRNAIINMLEIFINPDNQILWSSIEDAPLVSLKQEDVEAIKVLLAELNAKHPSPINQVYECYMLIYTNKKDQLEKALKKMTDLNKEEKEFAPALVVLALIKYYQKKQNDARNFLKTLAKQVYQPEYAEHFEMGWLMLADYLIAQGKYDQAEEYCQLCLKYNKSQVKAQEYMGVIKEREKKFVLAAIHYEQAWKLSSQSAPSIGFRLAFNYFKAKRFVETIDICHEILKNFPDYPDIKDKLLNPARASLRN